MEKDEKIFTFRIPVELLADLHRIAKAQDLTLAQLVRREMRVVVEKHNG